jgi:hypothetical protein
MAFCQRCDQEDLGQDLGAGFVGAHGSGGVLFGFGLEFGIWF